jgi:hypothetical protein
MELKLICRKFGMISPPPAAKLKGEQKGSKGKGRGNKLGECAFILIKE